MTGFYDRMAATAAKLLKKYGAAAVLSRVTAGDYDPATGNTIGETTATYSCFAAKFDYEQKDIDGTQIRVGDQRVYLSAPGVVQPQSGDTMTFTGSAKVFDVVTAKAINPAGTAVIFEVQVRGLQ